MKPHNHRHRRVRALGRAQQQLFLFSPNFSSVAAPVFAPEGWVYQRGLVFSPGHSPDVITGSIRKANQLGNRREILLQSTESHRACDPGPAASVCPQGFAHLHWQQLSPSLRGQRLCLKIATTGIKPFLRFLKKPKKSLQRVLIYSIHLCCGG